ncbi:MAG: sensor histidine kinase, partial [Myxococcaceae bacterium]
MTALVAFLVQHALLPEPSIAPFVLLYLSVVVASWLGGRGPGWAAALVTAALANVYFIAPFDRPTLSGPGLVATLLFLGTAVAIAVLCGSLRTAMEHTDQKARLVHQALARQKSVELALRSSEARFRRVFESNMIAITFWLADGLCTEANQAFCELVGYSQEEVQAGKLRWPDVTPPEWRARDREAFEEVKARGVSTPYRKQFVRRDGTRVDVLLGGALVGSAADPMVAFALDISDQKRMEEALRDADRRKDDFLGVLSHELRNPLAPIRNSVYLLSRSALDDRGKRATAVIDRQATQLSRLVDDLLDVTRIARGKVQLHRTRLDLAGIIRQAVEDQRAQFNSSRVELEADIEAAPVWVDGDAARLVQATDNLLHNARKFTPAGGRVHVSVARDDSGHAVVEVADNGVGIDAATR